MQATGRQSITVEDSMSMVHASAGKLKPASDQLRSEPAIVAGIAHATLPASKVAWLDLIDDYDRIRDLIDKTVSGFEAFNERIRTPGGFRLPLPPTERVWPTPTGKAMFSVYKGVKEDADVLGAEQVLRLITLRSHDQYNTTIYDDRYRGVFGRRDVLFMNPADLAKYGRTRRPRRHRDGHRIGSRAAPREDHRDRVRHRAGVGRRVLPGSERARAARLHRQGKRHTVVQVGAGARRALGGGLTLTADSRRTGCREPALSTGHRVSTDAMAPSFPVVTALPSAASSRRLPAPVRAVARREPVVQRRRQHGPTSHDRSAPPRCAGIRPAYIGVFMNGICTRMPIAYASSACGLKRP